MYQAKHKAELTILLIPVALCFSSNPNENILHAAVEHSLKFDPLDLVQYNPTGLQWITALGPFLFWGV